VRVDTASVVVGGRFDGTGGSEKLYGRNMCYDRIVDNY
jgi:hypothetical protein